MYHNWINILQKLIEFLFYMINNDELHILRLPKVVKTFS